MVGELPKTTGCGEGSRCEPFSGELFLRFRNEFDIKLFSATRVRWSACGLFLLWALFGVGFLLVFSQFGLFHILVLGFLVAKNCGDSLGFGWQEIG